MEEKIPTVRESLGHGIFCYNHRDTKKFIAKVEKNKYGGWNIIESCSGYINYNYETPNEAVMSAYYNKDYRIYKTGF